MELKWRNDLNSEALEKMAEKALEQIDEKRYDLEMKEENIGNILKMGIAFSGKKVLIKTK